jgi:hypothetical protein
MCQQTGCLPTYLAFLTPGVPVMQLGHVSTAGLTREVAQQSHTAASSDF